MGGLLSSEVPGRSLPCGPFQPDEVDRRVPGWLACLPTARGLGRGSECGSMPRSCGRVCRVGDRTFRWWSRR